MLVGTEGLLCCEYSITGSWLQSLRVAVQVGGGGRRGTTNGLDAGLV